MKFTTFEKEELTYKLEVIRDNDEWLKDIQKTAGDIDVLIKKVEENGELDRWEFETLAEEAENLLEIAEANYSDGFPEYYPDVRKLRKLNSKFEGGYETH